MIHTNTSLKYNILIEAKDFEQERDPWGVVIYDYFNKEYATIDKEDCFRDSEGGYYFTLPNMDKGKYRAITTVQIPDDDYEPTYMTITDRQHLVDVGLCDCHKPYRPCNCQCETEGLKVTFTRVFSTNLDDAAYLCDINGNLILTADGRRIQFNNNNER